MSEMFFPTNKFETVCDTPLIVSDYECLLYDEMPVLFTGKNNKGERVLGSSVDEDYATNTARYFHIVLSEAHWRRFVERKVSYSLLMEWNGVYVVDVNNDTNTTTVSHTTVSHIPAKYQPTPSTFYPESAVK